MSNDALAAMDEVEKEEFPSPSEHPKRYRLPQGRLALTHAFSIGGSEGKITVGFYPDGKVGEIFIKIAKQGSTLSGLMDAWAIAISMGIQYGVPIKAFANKFKDMAFPPEGYTDYSGIRQAKSLVDYVFQWLEKEFPDGRLKQIPTLPTKNKG
jgi:ribonucleoside-diphosphate reductase alpha chain